MFKSFIESIKPYFSTTIFMNENTDKTPKEELNHPINDQKDTSTENIETLETEEVPNITDNVTDNVVEATDTTATNNFESNNIITDNVADIISEETILENAPDNTTKIAQELADQKDKYLRLLADFENFRRRTAKEKIEFLEQANAKLILELLPVLDDFERAAKSMEAPETSIESVKNGITLVYGKFLKSLERQGLMPIHSNGEVFDVEKHEAITQIPAPTEDMKGKIVDTVEKGYTLGEKVVRFAKVVIGQ